MQSPGQLLRSLQTLPAEVSPNCKLTMSVDPMFAKPLQFGTLTMHLINTHVAQSPEELLRSLQELQAEVAAEKEAATQADRRNRELHARLESIAKVCGCI